jgi:hypothetical protein
MVMMMMMMMICVKLKKINWYNECDMFTTLWIEEKEFYFSFGATAPIGHGRLTHEVSRSHRTTHHSR